jgi:hypothetical protein
MLDLIQATVPAPAAVSIPGFISYSISDRVVAAEVKSVLAELGVDGFLAHEDIHVSQTWRDRILGELRRSKVFIPLLSESFEVSEWTHQEIGAAIVQESMVVLPIFLDSTRPSGFLSAVQGRAMPEPIKVEFFIDPLLRHLPRDVIPRLIERLAKARSFREAERLMKPLVPVFNELTEAEAIALATASTDNGEIWDAADCRLTYLPAFIVANRHQLPQRVLEPLAYQIEYETWHDGR